MKVFCAFLVTMVAVSPVSHSEDTLLTVTGRIEFANNGTDPSAAVVWLTSPETVASTKPASGRPHMQLLQKRKIFSPHVLVVPVGTRVDFPNRDPFFHNVFSLFEGKRFDLGLYEAGSTRTIVFDRTGISYVFCNIHPEMSAVVVALKTPYYGTSDKTGMIAIPNVPPGTFELHVWHERVLPETLDGLTRKVLVSETSRSFGTLRLTQQRILSPGHKNKYGQEYDIRPSGGPIYARP